MGGMLELPADDDDAMMELAIALSLHEEQGQAPAELGNLHPGLQGLVGGLPGLHRLQGLSGQVLHSLQVLAAGGMPGSNAQANAQEEQQVRTPNQGHVGIVMCLFSPLFRCHSKLFGISMLSLCSS